MLSVSVSKSYNGLRVLDNISFTAEEGEFVCIVGESGCGKTTLLRIVAGLESYEGKITFKGEEVDVSIGFVFQDDRLLPWRTALGNVLFGIEVRKKNVSKEDVERAKEVLRLVGLEDFENYYPKELSGGMRQRVGIARAIAIKPDVLLMDEPFASLDEQTRNRMQSELLEIWRRERKTVLFVTHSIEEAIFLADRVIVLSKRPARVLSDIKIELPRPRDRTSREFIEYKREIMRLLDH
jgi:NitT/TauT family transport system ATP-binding protein